MEIKQINIDEKITHKDFGEQLQLKLELNQGVSVELCMGFLLLRENLSSAICFKFKNFLFIFENGQGHYSYWESIDVKKCIFKGQVSNDAIDYILYYLLKFYRDSIAESEHIDISFSNNNGKEITFTISCSDYFEYSEDDMIKMLK